MINENIDFYEIKEDGGERFIRTKGYFYDTHDISNKHFRILFAESEKKLDDFLKFDKQDRYREFYEMLDKAKHFMHDMDIEEAEEQFQIWQEKSSLLPLEAIQFDTPVGEYRTEEM